MENEPLAATDEVRRQILQHTLQEVALGRQDNDSNNGDQHAATTAAAAAAECCVICLEAIEEPCEVQPCRHRNFDYLCVVNWLYQHPSCPLCKATVEQVRHETQDGIFKVTPIEKPTKKEPGNQSVSNAASQSYAGRPTHFHPARRRHHRPAGAAPPRRPPPPPGISDPLRRRQDVYRHLQFSKHVGSNRVSRYRELTPQMFLSDADLVSRARMFIRRELQVFAFLHIDGGEHDEQSGSSVGGDGGGNGPRMRRAANNAEFLLEYVVAILKSVDIMGSAGQAEDMLADFLGRENTRLFLHELRAWLRSPYTKLEDWDRAVQYDAPARASGQGQGAVEGADSINGERKRGGGGGGGRQLRGMRAKGDFYRPGAGRYDNDSRGQRSRPAPYPRRN